MNEITESAIKSVNESISSFCRFITANDTGETGGHQSGFYIPKSALSLFFDKPGVKGTNGEKTVKIKWQDDFITESHAKYYGVLTRNEYRLTAFGKNFPYLTEEYTGSLLIISKIDSEEYESFVLSEEEDIDDFLDAFGMSPSDTNNLISITGTEGIPKNITADDLIQKFIAGITSGFPETKIIADSARSISNEVYKIKDKSILSSPDDTILKWLETEFQLFRSVENHVYSEVISKRFDNVENFIKTANTILNRRKSRAGKSLEHHLESIFSATKLKFEKQPHTEDKKKPDFIFPGSEEYHNFQFPVDKLVFLGAKTTCKDRWRQVINEADRIDIKHLFTLQQGISKNQLKEMLNYKVMLVVPKIYINTFPQEYREQIQTLNSFINMVKEKQKL